jgi:hypothetical protein
MRSQDGNNTQGKRKEKKKGVKLVLLLKLILTGVSPPGFGFALPVPCITGAYSSLIKPVQNKTLN